MPFVTTLRLASGDREALDDVVGSLRGDAERKGIELHGPHTKPPSSYRVPLYRHPEGAGGRYPPWDYTVYERVIELSGHDEAVRGLTQRAFPRGVRVEVAVEQVRSIGQG